MLQRLPPTSPSFWTPTWKRGFRPVPNRSFSRPIDPFLHGLGEPNNADISVVWRHDRSLRDTETGTAPPFRVPAGADWRGTGLACALDWRKTAGDHLWRMSIRWSADLRPYHRDVGREAHRWVGYDNDPEPIADANDLRPGDVLIVNPDQGGLTAGSWDPASTQSVEDLGDEAQEANGRRVTLRLDPRIHPDSMGLIADEEAEVTTRDLITAWIDNTVTASASERLVRACQRLRRGFDLELSGNREYPIIVERTVDSSTLDGSDASVSFTGTAVTLRDHLNGVGDRAAEFANRLGLGTEFREDLRLAGLLHDLGKVDRRFQAQLVGGDVVRAGDARRAPCQVGAGNTYGTQLPAGHAARGSEHRAGPIEFRCAR